MADLLIHNLRNSKGWPTLGIAAADRIEGLQAKVKTLEKGLEAYQRERDRFKHSIPEMSGAFFLSGGHGEKDNNQMPEFIEICPAYGCAWVKIYQATGNTISYEGSQLKFIRSK